MMGLLEVPLKLLSMKFWCRESLKRNADKNKSRIGIPEFASRDSQSDRLRGFSDNCYTMESIFKMFKEIMQNTKFMWRHQYALLEFGCEEPRTRQFGSGVQYQLGPCQVGPAKMNECDVFLESNLRMSSSPSKHTCSLLFSATCKANL